MRKAEGWFGGVWGQIRWQLVACYLLIGGVSVVLVAAFGLTALNLIILRSSSATVERQIALLVEQAGDRADAFAGRMEAQERGPRPPGLRGGGRGRGPSNLQAVMRCRDAKGKTEEHTFPPDARVEIPGWVGDGDFQGVVSEGPAVWIQAVARRHGERCSVEALARIAVDDELADLMTRSLEMNVSLRTFGGRGGGLGPGAGPGPRPGGRPGWWRWFWLPLQLTFSPPGDGQVPVSIVTRDWATGQAVDRMPLTVRPNYARTLEQLGRFGQRQAFWVRALWMIAIAFVLVELAALYLAARVTRRIVGAVDRLSGAAVEIAQGNLSHRIPVRSSDQLGQLSQSFNHMAASVEALVQETRERERLQQELLIAREVQQSLYPRELPEVPSADLGAVCHPARNVSGDVYDIVRLGRTGLGLLCADVSGKGIAAALLAASVQAMVRSTAEEGASNGRGPADLVSRLNKQLCPQMPDNRFVTLFWGEYDAVTRVLRSTNAGHCPPFVLLPGEGGVKRLERGGPPVGLFAKAAYETQDVKLEPGSVLVLYTDGISEAANVQGEEYGDERLIRLCESKRDRVAQQIVDDVLAARDQWAGNIEPSDDLTVVVLKAL